MVFPLCDAFTCVDRLEVVLQNISFVLWTKQGPFRNFNFSLQCTARGSTLMIYVSWEVPPIPTVSLSYILGPTTVHLTGPFC